MYRTSVVIALNLAKNLGEDVFSWLQHYEDAELETKFNYFKVKSTIIVLSIIVENFDTTFNLES